MKKISIIIILLILCGCSKSETFNVLLSGQSNAESIEFNNALDNSLNLKFPSNITNVARGGTNLDAWQPNGSWYLQNIEKLNKRIDIIVWWQGEADSESPYPEAIANYGERLERLINSWRQKFGDVPFIIIELQTLDTGGADTIRQAQHNIADSMNEVYLIPTTDITFGELHPDYAYTEIAERISRLIETL